MDLAISILLIVLALILLIIGTYLFRNRARPFLVFDPRKEHGLKIFCTYFSIFMFICALLTVLVVFYTPAWLLITIIFLDVICTFIVPFVLWGYTL
ncbi:hypothetical protein Lacidipiscis_01400 [Ligilactobacillus acidipiscis]|uniref:Integral membrane protein n=1 Tax=Ligilactobacillus acidipiscis TaxID=89059 RepID=A0A1K1KPN9_9LACO|nr:hypothetical protein Lacidipiscis_01400 [Ligilactobacillus acidipiscis]SFV40834.1 hypothetical protein LAC1533_1414 [Ligilactobacillus acidipiscis]